MKERLEDEGRGEGDMNENAYQLYWKPCFETFYDAYYKELCYETLLNLWEKVDVSTGLLVAITATGSAIAGLAVWSLVGWKLIWGALAAIASLSSIVHRVMQVPSRIKQQEENRREFSSLRVDLDTFRQQLKTGIEGNQAKSKFEKLRERYSKCMERVTPDIALTSRIRNKTQDQLDNILKGRGYIHD